MLAPVIGNVIISEVDALMYVILSMVEKQGPYGELVGTRDCSMLYLRCDIQTKVIITEFNYIYFIWN
jgi:hypothetical protein